MVLICPVTGLCIPVEEEYKQNYMQRQFQAYALLMQENVR